MSLCAAAFADPETYIRATIPVVTERISFSKIAEVVSKVTGKHVIYKDIDRDTFASLPFPGAADLANMFAYYCLCNTFADLRPIEKAAVKGKTFEESANENAAALKAELAATDQ